MRASILKNNISKLKETFSNKDLLKYVTEEYDLSPNFPATLNDEIAGYELTDGSLRKAFRFREFFNRTGYDSTDYSVEHIIAVYFLDHFRSADSISLDISKVGQEHLTNLYRVDFIEFARALYEVFESSLNPGFNVTLFRLFKEIYEIAWKALGVEESLVLINDFIGEYHSKNFMNDSRSYIEIFFQGVENLRTRDREYPLDWVISSDVLNERYMNT